MYGSLSRVNAQNHKAKLADSYNQLLRQISDNELKTIGNYTVSKLIGSFGKVYLATHKFTHSKVVLKSSPKDQPHLVREIHHHRLFKHPHIARLYEVIVTDRLVWLVLEYCPGDELYTYLIDNTRLKMEEAKRIFSQLVGAVAYTHSRHCTHRDLKLENVLLDRKNNVKLCDFGFTREYEPRSMLDTVCGTTCYMAPEMLLNKSYDGEKVDVWSLGVIFYSLIYGEHPFDEDSDVDTKMKIVSEEPKFPELDEMTGGAEELLNSILTKDPKDRPTLDDILNHPYLEEYTPTQREILAEKVPKWLSTKAEKRVLRSLRAAHVDLEQLADSVMTASCDPLCGFWSLALEREERIQKRRSRRTSLSISKYSHRKSSDKPRKRSPSQSETLNRNRSTSASKPFPVQRLSSDKTELNNNSTASVQESSVQASPPAINLQPQSTPHDDSNITYSPSAKSSMSTVLARTNEKRRELGHSFKNVMLKIMLPSKKRRQHEDDTPDVSKENNEPTPELNTSEFELANQSLTVEDYSRPRPVSGVSQISQFSQLSQFSGVSASSMQSANSYPERTGSFSRTGRPTYGRRSTSSSFSSLISRAKRNHSKTSSTSSASLNSSPVGSRRISASPDHHSPTLGYHRQLGGIKGKYNETAVFSSHHRVRNMRKSPFTSPRGSRSGRSKATKQTVIEEDNEEEYEDSDDDQDETEGDTAPVGTANASMTSETHRAANRNWRDSTGSFSNENTA